MGLVYKITNKKTGAFYIGQTTRTFNKRWAEHCANALRKAKKGRPLTKFETAIVTYSKESFSHEILEDNIKSQRLLSNRETYYIRRYQAQNYYNSNSGNGPRYRWKDREISLKNKKKIKYSSTQRLKPKTYYPSPEERGRYFKVSVNASFSNSFIDENTILEIGEFRFLYFKNSRYISAIKRICPEVDVYKSSSEELLSRIIDFEFTKEKSFVDLNYKKLSGALIKELKEYQKVCYEKGVIPKKYSKVNRNNIMNTYIKFLGEKVKNLELPYDEARNLIMKKDVQLFLDKSSSLANLLLSTESELKSKRGGRENLIIRSSFSSDTSSFFLRVLREVIRLKAGLPSYSHFYLNSIPISDKKVDAFGKNNLMFFTCRLSDIKNVEIERYFSDTKFETDKGLVNTIFNTFLANNEEIKLRANILNENKKRPLVEYLVELPYTEKETEDIIFLGWDSGSTSYKEIKRTKNNKKGCIEMAKYIINLFFN